MLDNSIALGYLLAAEREVWASTNTSSFVLVVKKKKNKSGLSKEKLFFFQKDYCKGGRRTISMAEGGGCNGESAVAKSLQGSQNEAGKKGFYFIG